MRSNADTHPEPNGDADPHKYSDRDANSYSNCDSYLYAVANPNNHPYSARRLKRATLPAVIC